MQQKACPISVILFNFTTFFYTYFDIFKLYLIKIKWMLFTASCFQSKLFRQRQKLFLTNLCSLLLNVWWPRCSQIDFFIKMNFSRSMKIDQLVSDSQVIFHLLFMKSDSARFSSFCIKIPLIDLSLVCKHRTHL